MQYNSRLNKLILPEYGRNVQRMVEHALTIPDRALRTRCAHSIIKFMGNLLPYLRDAQEFKHKLWDHLVIMSDFELDIDYPSEVVGRESLLVRPEALEYPHHYIRYRIYGRLLEDLIYSAQRLPEGSVEQKQLLMHVASRMKYIRSEMKSASTPDDDKIYNDIEEYMQAPLPFARQPISIKGNTPPAQNNNSKKNHYNQRKFKNSSSRGGR